MKSHSGAKKRWRSLASGTAFKRVRPRLKISSLEHLTQLFTGQGLPLTSQPEQKPGAEE